MSTTAGFQVVAEVTQGMLQQILLAAWDSSLIPHSYNIPGGLAFGPYQVADGVVNIPRAGLSLAMATAINGVTLTLPAQIQIQIANPPIPSASMFAMTANLIVSLPVGIIPPSAINVGLLMQGLPRSDVTVNLTSGDPVSPITLQAIKEYVDARYQDGTIPSTIAQNDATFGIFTADAFAEIFDDPNDPARQITVTQPASGQVQVSLPLHLKLSNMTAAAGPQPLSPLGVTTRVNITAPLVVAPGSISAQLGAAAITVGALTPAAGVEGSNYTADKAGASAGGMNLDNLLSNRIQSYAQNIANTLGTIAVAIPTVGQIEAFIGDQVQGALSNRSNIAIWTPDTPANSGITVTGVAPKALSDALAIGMDPIAGADVNSLTNFIPAGRDFSVAIDGAKVLDLINQQIHRPESEGGFGPSFPPKTFHNIDGHDARLTSLTVTLQEGSIHIAGDVTVINAIAGHIDVDASFTADAGMQWQDNADGTQSIQPITLDTDVDLSLLAWIVSFLLGFITAGLIGGIIALVVMIVASNIASQVGGSIIRNDVTNQVKGITAWPQTLEGIGTVSAKFSNPIDIHADSVVFSG